MGGARGAVLRAGGGGGGGNVAVWGGVRKGYMRKRGEGVSGDEEEAAEEGRGERAGCGGG